MISALTRFPDGTVELTITLPWKKIEAVYHQTLAALSQKTEIRGFRKGKAPKKLIEDKIGKQKVYEEVLKNLLPQIYQEAITEQQIKPIIAPQIKVLSLEEKKDWQIKAVTCELPEVKLNDYQSEIKKSLATEKIWVPGKDKNKAEEKPSREKKLEKIFQTLLKTSRVQIPEILIQEEVNRMLSRLIDQTGKLGLTVEQYLASSGKTSDQLQKEYRRQAEEVLKLELILSSIADKQKVEIKEEEVDEFLRTIPEEKIRKEFAAPKQKLYLRQLLRKQRVIDNLSNL